MNGKFLMIAASCATALSPIGATFAWADTIPEPVADALSSANLATMESTCDALAETYDTGNGDIWAGNVILGTVTKVSGPTEQEGTRVIDESTIQHAGTYVPSTLEIRGDPFRIGGSVNMFGDQWSSAGYWTDSTYDYTADFDSTFSHAYSCEITRAVFHEGQTIHHRAVGVYVFNDDGTGNDEDAVRANCEQYTDNGQPWWGDPYRPNPQNPRCRFEGTAAYDEVIPDSWDAPVQFAVVAQTAINQDQTDTLTAFEDHGGPVQVTGEYHVGQVVVCISPSTNDRKGNPGAWRTQNGYTGDKCTTDWFQNHAIWGSGTESSNGTYTSVPDYNL